MNATAKRFPGKYIVIGLVAFVVLFLLTGFLLAYRLGPSADKWREGDRIDKKK